jgi:uncharacterized Rmd1/YagE family protein
MNPTFYYKVYLRCNIITDRLIIGGFMAKLPDDHGQGLVEWILIILLVLMVLVTVFFLLRPALGNLWQEMLETIQ